jgi:Rieske Fe-S protein
LAEQEAQQFARKLAEKYGMKGAEDVIASAYTSKPKLRVLLSRASFRADAVRTDERIRTRKERRNFLRNLLGAVAASVPFLLWLKAAYFSPQAQAPAYVSNPSSGSQTGGRILVKAGSIPEGQSLSLNDPTLGPLLLIHLTNGQFVAFSAICTHAGCTVQFNPSAQDIACPCHGAIYDPYNNAQVVAEPAPLPLQKIPIRYDQPTGNIYLAS